MLLLLAHWFREDAHRPYWLSWFLHGFCVCRGAELDWTLGLSYKNLHLFKSDVFCVNYLFKSGTNTFYFVITEGTILLQIFSNLSSATTNFTYMAKHYNFRFMLSFLLMFKCPCKCNMTQRWFSTQIFLWGLLVYLFFWKLISGGNIYRIPFQIMVCVVKFFEIRKQWFWTMACIMPLPCISFISPLRICKYMSNT